MGIKSLFKSRSRQNKNVAAQPESGASHDNGAGGTGTKAKIQEKHRTGRIYAVWSFLLPILIGLTLGWFASVCLGIFFTRSGFVVSHGPIVTNIAKAASESEVRGMGEFLATNPFRVSPMVVDVPMPEPVISEDPGPKVIGSLATAIMRGTFPDVGVWLEDQGKTRLVLIGTSFDVYTLVAVSYHDAVFMKDDDVVVRDMTFGAPTVVKRPTAAANSGGNREVTSTRVGDVVPAIPGEQDGAVPSGLVNELVQNPFEELKKVRLRPKDGELGLEIQWIQDESILHQLGVQQGDVVKAVNGISFNNMADIANSINSLMNSERFDVEVVRDGKTTSLRYVVR